MQSLLSTLKLNFADPREERAFRADFVTRQMALARPFFVLAGLITAAFQPWDVFIDPVGSQTTIWIRLGVMASVCWIGALLLGWRWARDRFDAILLIVAATNTIGNAVICAILAGGYNLVSSAMMLVILFLISLFRMRTPSYLLFALLTLVGYLASLAFARDYASGMGVMNGLQIGTALLMGAISVIARERSARTKFLADREIVRSHDRIEELLHSMLPAEIVRRMHDGETLIADVHSEVSIVFSDLVGFTELSRRVTAPELVSILNRIFSAFDEAADHHGMHKIKTIGDAYMAIGGVVGPPDERGPARNAAGFALAMLEIVEALSAELDVSLRVRVGLHVGPVVAGVIGTSRPAFDCWGQAVNLASRLESAAAPGAILLSEQAWERLREHCPTRVHDEVQLKGIGLAKVYELLAREATQANSVPAGTSGSGIE